MNNQNEKREIKWTIDIPLLNNKILIRQIMMVFFLTFVIVSMLMLVIFLAQGELGVRLPKLLLIFFLVCLGLFALSILVMLIVMGNKMTLRFTVDNKGVLYEMLDKRGKRLTALAILSGLFRGKPTEAGAGAISKSRETVFISYKNITKIEPQDKENVILLKNEWRTLLAIYCKKENYNEVKEFINEVAKNIVSSEKKAKKPSTKIYSLRY